MVGVCNYCYICLTVKTFAVYEKKEIEERDIQSVIRGIKNGEIEGINVTVPFKKSVIPFLDDLENLAKKTQSVNTIYKKNNKIIGANTDIKGFSFALKHIKYKVKGKKIFILGAGGVTPSIIFALKQMEASTIMLTNRTKEKAESLKKQFSKTKTVAKQTRNCHMPCNPHPNFKVGCLGVSRFLACSQAPAA